MDQTHDPINRLPQGWLTRLEGEELAKRESWRLFQSDIARVILHEGNYHLQSSLFDAFSDADLVGKQAAQLAHLMNGAARMQTDGYGGIRVGTILQIGEDGAVLSANIFLSSMGGSRSSGEGTLTQSRDGVVIKQARQLSIEERAVALAQQDEVIARVLRILGGEHTWGPLYHVYDAIVGQMGGIHKLRKMNWVPEKDLDWFSHTANHPDVSGDLSRHGYTKRVPPSDPMSISEAEIMIAHLFREWIRSKWPDDQV